MLKLRMKWFVFVGIFVFEFAINIFALETKGAINLDSWTFDKVVNKFPYTLVKFDVPFPYGEAHDEFGKFAESAHSIDDLILAEVGVHDYAEKENVDLAERFGIKKEDFPAVRLFSKERPSQPIAFKSDSFKIDEIKKFLKSAAGIHIGLSSCLQEFDRLAAEFMRSDEEKRQELMAEAENLSKTFEEEAKEKSAKTYVLFMTKILQRGDGFVSAELERMQTIQKGKVTKDKKSQFQTKINILLSFSQNIKDEL